MCERSFGDVAFFNRVFEIEVVAKDSFEERTVFGEDGIKQSFEQILHEFAAQKLLFHILDRSDHTQTVGGVVGVFEEVIFACFNCLFVAENRLYGFRGFVERDFDAHGVSGHDEGGNVFDVHFSAVCGVDC